MAARRPDSQTAHLAYLPVVWAWGYLSRYNRESPVKRVDIPSSSDTIQLYLEKFCREHPLQGVALGVESLLTDLGGDPAKSWSRR
jgi:hypothetical protein